jgi:hypothetical protein
VVDLDDLDDDGQVHDDGMLHVDSNAPLKAECIVEFLAGGDELSGDEDDLPISPMNNAQLIKDQTEAELIAGALKQRSADCNYSGCYHSKKDADSLPFFTRVADDFQLWCVPCRVSNSICGIIVHSDFHLERS